MQTPKRFCIHCVWTWNNIVDINNLALFREFANLVQCYSANWSQTRGRKKISLSRLYESRKRGATVNKYALIEFITVCAAVKATGDPDSTLSLHSEFKLLSLSYLRYYNLIEYSLKMYYILIWNISIVLHAHIIIQVFFQRDGVAGSEGRFCLYVSLSLENFNLFFLQRLSNTVNYNSFLKEIIKT